MQSTNWSCVGVWVDTDEKLRLQRKKEKGSMKKEKFA